MVGLLQAIPHTQLARRLKAEGRLLATLSSTGNHTVEGINFIPYGEMTKREYLEKYRVLVHEVYKPEAYFARTLLALLQLQAKAPLAAMCRHRAKLLVVLSKESYYFGLRAKAMRFYFWRRFGKSYGKGPARSKRLFSSARFFTISTSMPITSKASLQSIFPPQPRTTCSTKSSMAAIL